MWAKRRVYVTSLVISAQLLSTISKPVTSLCWLLAPWATTKYQQSKWFEYNKYQQATNDDTLLNFDRLSVTWNSLQNKHTHVVYMSLLYRITLADLDSWLRIEKKLSPVVLKSETRDQTRNNRKQRILTHYVAFEMLFEWSIEWIKYIMHKICGRENVERRFSIQGKRAEYNTTLCNVSILFQNHFPSNVVGKYDLPTLRKWKIELICAKNFERGSNSFNHQVQLSFYSCTERFHDNLTLPKSTEKCWL